MSKKETINSWKIKIATRPKWAIRAAIRINSKQTEQEKCYGNTIKSNGVGLNSFDAPVITPIVEKYKRDKTSLNNRDIYQLQRVMPKYAGQLYKLVNARVTNG